MRKDNKRKKIAVILANMQGEYVFKTLQGIEEEARKNNVDIYMFNANASTDETLKHNIGEYNIYNLTDYTLFDGVILFANLIQGHSVYSKVIEDIKAAGVVVVSIDVEVDGFYFVGAENYRPMKTIVEHLIEYHNFTKINYVSGQDFNSDSRERLAAYCDALCEHGITVDERRIFKGAFTNTHGREVASKMMEMPQLMPEAIVCATDSIAIGVRSVFDRYGIDIPKQIVITGFDNTFEAKNSVPRMTTVSRNQRQVGREALLRVLRVLEGEKIPKKERFPAMPIFRESCGCCGEEKDDIVTLRRKYVERAEHYDKNLFTNVMMVEELGDSKTFREFLDTLKSYVKILECDSFYLCLDEKLVEDLSYADVECGDIRFHDHYQTDGYPEIMSVVLGYENGRFFGGEEFKSKKMLPETYDIGDSNHIYLFSPLHFRDRCMGYVVLDNSKFAAKSQFYSTWLINLSDGLESLRKQAQLKNMVERVDKMYVRDPLTGLYNRFGLSRYTGESFSRCIAMGSSFMVLFADLDGLKGINDKFGHDNGDVAISVVAFALQKACSGNEICARIGGDEFVVYAEEYTAEDAVLYCRRLEKLIEMADAELDKPCHISVSYGYEVVCPQAGDTVDKYIDMADDKMYINKKKKKNISRDNGRIVK